MNVDFNKYFNLAGMNKAQQQQFIMAMTDLILAHLADMIGEHLTEQELTELEAIGKSGDSQAMFGWLDQHVPNFGQGVDEILKEESVALAAKVKALTDLAFGEQAHARP